MDNTNNNNPQNIPAMQAIADYYALLDDEPIRPEEYALWRQSACNPFMGEASTKVLNIQRFVLEMRGIKMEDFIRAYPARVDAP